MFSDWFTGQPRKITFARMARVLAIDYGKKRCGLAMSDPLQMIANGLETVENAKLFEALDDLMSQHEIEALVIGLPKHLSGHEAEIEPEIKKRIVEIQNKFPDLKIHRFDERFTSKMALDAMIAMGSTKKQRREKGNIDKISATLILQDYLDKGK